MTYETSKYKILLVGSNETVVDQFFVHMEGKFETQYCSQRIEDIMNHIKYFQPDLFLCCIAQENASFYNRMVAAKLELDNYNIPMGIIGSKEVCNDFMKGNSNLVDLCMYRPISNASIEEKINRFLGRRKVNKPKNNSIPDISSIGDIGDLSGIDDILNMSGIGDIGNIRNTGNTGLDDTERELLELEKLQKELEAEINKSENNKSNVRKHVLIVDDDPVMLKLLKGYLQDNYDTAVAINGKVALKFLEKNHTDLVLLDYEMPEEKGPAVLEKIRNNPKLKNLPVVFLTGVNVRDMVEGCLKLRPNGYMLKPIDSRSLNQKVREILG